MGKYINQLPDGTMMPTHHKALNILNQIPGSKVIPKPDTFVEDLVCVVDNGPFEAAAYCDSPNEFRRFTRIGDDRSKIWMTVPNVDKIAN